jgi:hypothetical protein
LKFRNPTTDVWLSVLFGYYNTLLDQKESPPTDLGCIPRNALEVLTNIGFCNTENWPFDQSKVLVHPLPDAYAEAFDQRLISKYYKITATGDALVQQIKQAISSGYPVIYGSPIDSTYEAYAGGGKVLNAPTGEWLGSHMRCLVGYTADYAIEANSWSTGWGNNGLGYIGWDFIKWPSAFDFWVFDGVPQPTG